MTAAYDVISVSHLGRYRLLLAFADGSVRTVDLGPKLTGDVGPMFEPLREVAYSGRVSLDPELGTIVWPNGADIAPDVLYEGRFDEAVIEN